MNAISLPMSKHTLSHNLLTPLTGVLGNIWLLNEEINQASMSPEQMMQLINQFKRIWNDVKASSEEILKFAQCLIEQAREIEVKNTSTDTYCLLENPDKWLSVLIVEDDPAIQNTYSELFKSLNCTVDIASNGYEALDILSTTHNAIFMDIDMPGMNGIETTAKIRQRWIGQKHIPIIAVTTSLSDIQSTSQKAKFDAFAQNPLDKKQLQELLKKLTEN